jgi:hypothetical protein
LIDSTKSGKYLQKKPQKLLAFWKVTFMRNNLPSLCFIRSKDGLNRGERERMVWQGEAKQSSEFLLEKKCRKHAGMLSLFLFFF